MFKDIDLIQRLLTKTFALYALSKRHIKHFIRFIFVLKENL